jgi:hypothetical protein
MNIISILDYKGEKILKISLNIVREFESVNIQDRLGLDNNYEKNNCDVFCSPKIKKLLELRYTKDDVYLKENVEIPFELEINKVYHFYCCHQKKKYQVYMNNYLILEADKIPYHYPGNIEAPIIFQVSSIDKSITPVEIMKSIHTEKERNLIYCAGEMYDNSTKAYVKDYKRRLIVRFPDITSLEPFDINQTAIMNFNEE